MTNTVMQIPQVDLAAQFRSVREEVMHAIEQVLESSQLFLGPQTQAFEAEFAAFCGSTFCIGVGNGTDALHLALRAVGVGPGDEVITVSHTFIAAVEAIAQVGAKPVFVDIDPVTMNMDVRQVEQRITPRTKAIVPVHLYGRLVDMTSLMELARRRDLVVVEDASQAHGAVNAHGAGAGSLGHVATFSFYYAKNLGAYGEAGAVTTSDPELDRRIRLLRSHGEAVRYEHEVLGFNSRIDELQAAVLRIKLRHLQAWNALRLQHAIRYDELLADLAIARPQLVTDGSHVYHQYVVRSPRRDELRQALAEQGVATGVHYPIPVHLQPACRDLGYSAGDLPHTERVAREVLSLPMYAELTSEQLSYVAATVAAAVARPEARVELDPGSLPAFSSSPPIQR